MSLHTAFRGESDGAIFHNRKWAVSDPELCTSSSASNGQEAPPLCDRDPAHMRCRGVPIGCIRFIILPHTTTCYSARTVNVFAFSILLLLIVAATKVEICHN